MPLRLLACLAILVSTPLAWACSCVSGSPCELAKTEVIFTGTVTAVTYTEFTSAYTFQVAETFRGGVAGLVQIVTPRHDASCGASFVVGPAYLVYASQNAGQLHTTACHGSLPLSRAHRHLAHLRRALPGLSAPAPTAHLSGFVTHRESDRTGAPPPTWPVAGVQVSARQPNGFVKRITTDAEGEFEFPELPAGRYHLEVGGPGYETTPQPQFDLEPGSCTQIAIVNRARSVLEGRLVIRDEDHTWTPVTLRLVPLDGRFAPPGWGDNELETEAGDDRTFRFEVPAGRYRVEAPNALGCDAEDLTIRHPNVVTLGDRPVSLTFVIPACPR